MAIQYRRVYLPGHPRADAIGHVLEHVVIAERALGKALPKRAQVHHVDGNKRNNVRSNLVVCQDMAYHTLLHLRARIVRAGGNPDTQLICCVCRRLLSYDAFNRASHSIATRRQTQCRECSKQYERRYQPRTGIPRGAEKWNARLDEQKVREIRQRIAAGEMLVSIAAAYGVTDSCVRQIKRCRTWRHVA